VWLKVGPEFGKVTFAYQMGVLLGFTPLLVYVQDFGWPLSLMLASFTVVVSGTALCVAMVKGGMVTGFRAVFVSFLTVLQINLVLNAIVTFELPAQLTLLVNAGCYVGLLLTLLLGLRRDDGAGRLYGSGVEVFYFVCGVLLLGTGTTAGLYFMVPTVEDATAQLAGVTMGGVVLCCPVIARALGNRKTSSYSATVGLRVGLLLDVVGGVHMLALTQSGVEIKETVQYMAAYALTYLALMALAIERFKVALLVAYLIWLVSAAASVLLNSLYADPWLKLMTIVGLSAIATTGELVLVRKMSVDRAMARDDRKLDRIHRAAVSSQRELEQIRDAKPKDPRAKHVAKAARINEEGRLPSISQLSFNGVLEHSGVVEWCEATGTRPTLPFAPQLLVGRGSFYYLFRPSGSRMPTERALGAWLLYGARCAMHPSFSHPLLGPPLHHLLFIHLSVPWGKAGKNFFLRLSSRAEMLRWHADLSARASVAAKSSATAQRRTIRTDARAPDPEMAPGYELLRKHKQFARQQAARRVANEMQMQKHRRSAAGAGGGRPARAGSGSGGRLVQGASGTKGARSTSSTHVGVGVGVGVSVAAPRRSAPAGPRAATKALVLADGHYIYTPRNVSGTAQAEMQHYELQPPLRKSLAKSAREAAEANEALAAANGKRGCGGMPSEVAVSIEESVMGFASLKADPVEGRKPDDVSDMRV